MKISYNVCACHVANFCISHKQDGSTNHEHEDNPIEVRTLPKTMQGIIIL